MQILEDRTLLSATLVADLNPASAGSSEFAFVDVGETTYFSVNDGTHGAELWKTDGAPGGATLVKDINPGFGSSSPTSFTNVDGQLYFVANNGVSSKIWTSDGTTAGTQVVAPIATQSLFTGLGQLVSFDEKLYFVNGRNLWSTDGTEAGTQLVVSMSSSIENLTVVDDQLFWSTDFSNIDTIYVSDGTAAGTSILTPSPTFNLSSVSTFFSFNGDLYFRASNGTNGVELWKSNGTTAGTAMLKDIRSGSLGSTPSEFTVSNGTLFFSANDGTNGVELWKTDGTNANTVLVRNIRSGSQSSSPTQLTDVNGTLYFAADDGINGIELWKSDGSNAGTVLVENINGTSSTSNVGRLRAHNGTLYFTANDGATGIELWTSNGTAATTSLVRDINPGVASGVQSLAATDNGLFVVADDGVHGTELWTSNGTLAGTNLFQEFNTSTANAEIFLFGSVEVNGVRYFRANIPGTGSELWRTNGTAAGTMLVKDILPGTGSSAPSQLTVMNGIIYFVADDGTDPLKLWRTDGTEAGTYVVKEVGPGSPGTGMELWGVVNGKLLFSADDEVNGSELWVSDGTEAGTQLLKDINAGGNGSNIDRVGFADGKMFFSTSFGLNGHTLWVSDGTEAGTVPIEVDIPGDLSFESGYTVVGDKYYFSVDEDGIQTLWRTDGTAAGTFRVKDAIVEDGFLTGFTAVGDDLYFAVVGPEGNELWRSDGTEAGTYRVKEGLAPVAGDGAATEFVALNGRLIFLAEDLDQNEDEIEDSHGLEIWATDGTEAGTVLLKDIFPGANGSDGAELTKVGNAVYFSANDGTNGQELWVTDGTPSGTVLAQDVRPGAAGSDVQMLVGGAGALYFVANDGQHGRELWTLVPEVPATDVQMRALTANGGTTLTVEYEIIGADAGAFDLGIYRSSDGTFGGDELLSTVTIDNPADLTVGVHVLTFTIGSGVGQISLPGLGASETSGDYQLLAVADPANALAEDDAVPFDQDNVASLVGVYHGAGGSVFVHGSDDPDTVTVTSAGNVQVNLNGDIYTYTAADVSDVRIRTHGGADSVNANTVAETFYIYGGAGDDTLRGGGRSDQIDGGLGSDHFIVEGLSGNDTITLANDATPGRISATRGSEVDLFTFEAGDDFTVNAGLGNDTINVRIASTVVVNGQGGLDRLTADNTVNNWVLDGADAGVVGNITFTQVENLTGGSSVDTFLIGDDDSLTGQISGNGGADIIDYSTRTGPVLVDLATRTSNGIGSFTLVESFIGTSGADALKGTDANATWTINALNSGTVGSTSFAGFEILAGGTANDNFRFTDTGSLTGGIEGSLGGTDTISGAALANTWNINEANGGTLNGILFIGIENLTGGTQADLFNFGEAGSLSGAINGGTLSGVVDTIDFSQKSVPVDVDLATRTATDLGSFSLVESFIGTSSGDTLRGANANATWTINALDSGTVGTTSFTGFETLVGGTANDNFRFTDTGSLTGGVDGTAGGTDTVTGAAVANTWNIDNANAGTLNGNAFSGIENLTGSNQADRFNFGDAGSLSGAINGGTLSGIVDTIDFSQKSVPVNVDLATRTATDLGSFSLVESFIGTSSGDTLRGANSNATWTINALDSGTVGTTSFTGFETLVGGTANDNFRFTDTGSLTGGVDGTAGGTDTVTGAAVANTWNIDNANAGTLNGNAFSGIENLTGSNQADRFNFGAAGSISGTINGGAGTDTLDFSGAVGPVTVDLALATSTYTGSFTAIEAFAGSASNSDVLIGPNSTNTWVINSENGGTLGTRTFEAFENLVGGSGADTFSIRSTGSVSGTIDGGLGAGVNTLDYATLLTTVVVNLSQGIATSTAGVLNIQNAVGGSGADTLVGDNRNNLLRGNAGVDIIDGGDFGNDILVGGNDIDVLQAGAGRTILIGGRGSDTVTGGSEQDILIGRATRHDTNVTALNALMAEWSRTDLSYDERIDHLTGAVPGGLNGSTLLNNAALVNDSAQDFLLGLAELDWFWATNPQILDLEPGERVGA